MGKFLILAIGFLFMTGCVASEIPGRIAQRVSNPIFNFTRADAATTIEAVNKNPSMTEAEKSEATRCPYAIIHFDDLRKELLDIAANLSEGEQTRGLIYYATMKTYGQGAQDRVRSAAQRVINDCSHLIVNNSDIIIPGIK